MGGDTGRARKLTRRRVDLTDAALSDFRRGDDHVFLQLVQLYSGDLAGIARSFADSDDEAEDLVQETWARVFLHRQQYGGAGSLGGWIRRVCRNTCLSHVRDAARRRELLRRAPTDAVMSEGVVEVDQTTHGSRANRRILNVLSGLTARQQQVLWLRVLGDFGTRTVASQLGCPTGTVKSDLHRTLQALRRPEVAGRGMP